MRAMKCCGWLLGCILLLACCDRRTSLEVAQEGAMVAAETYYQSLLDGQYQQFLDGRAGADSLPQGYRQQLMDAYKQFVVQQQKARRGIQKVSATHAVADTTAMPGAGGAVYDRMQVFLLLCFGDSTSEEIVVPMVSRQGLWLME